MQKSRFLPALLAVFLLAGCGSKPYDDAVTVASLADAAANTEEILAAISSRLGSETVTAYCAVPGSRNLADTLDLNAWTVMEAEPSGEPGVTLRFPECWILPLSPDGQAAAYHGCASSGARGQCIYQIPEPVSAAVSDCLAENGTPHSPGDGSISASTFQH